ncbi:MAG TPA: hypothetical protein VN628_07555, partial [Vicinamibacterales bacterium]|nr:hypothetical protein [Vicinamibacterales bacterium]
MKFAVACLSLLLSTPAFAQVSGPQPLEAPNPNFEFLSRYDFQLEANLIGGDPNPDLFRWDAHFGGEFDVVNYVKGRLTVVTDYEAVMGSELRPFDPVQGNYVLEPAASWFAGNNEFSFVFHHVSKHLSDRPKRYAIAFNIAEGRYLRKFNLHGTTVAVRATVGHLMQHSDVDYTWAADWDVDVVHPVNPYFQWYGRSTGEMYGTNPVVRGRSDVQHTLRLEVGPRVIGTRADFEFFAGVEHRLDAYEL